MLAECFRSIDDFSLLQLKIFLNLCPKSSAICVATF